MRRGSSIILVGTLVFAWAVCGLSAGRTASPASPENMPLLPSETAPVPFTRYPLPSDTIFGSQEPFTQTEDPNTGKLTPSDPIGTPTLGFIDEQFLTYIANNLADPTNHIRFDSFYSACQYYLTIKAVTDCSPFGDLINPITFDAWKKVVGIDQYGPPGATDTAQFINQVDLNLTRDHHMISYGRDQLAAYVCNHAGPQPSSQDPTGLFPTPKEVDRLLRDIKRNQHLIACVAMEYSARNAPPGTPPFTKFYIFGPSGALLSSVDLDGRGAKQVPNACTACHGGTFRYTNAAGQFDQTKSPNGDLGAHFLPFDLANFAFASKLTEAEKEAKIFKMNLDVYITESNRWSTNAGFISSGFASASIQFLIEGWYGNVTPTNTDPHFNLSYVPSPAWTFDSNHQTAYQKTVSHSCRTCHVAMDNYAFEINSQSLATLSHDFVCNPTTPNPLQPQHVMPNSKVTFDRFWLSQDPNAPGQPPQDPGGQPNYLSFLFPGQPCNGP